MLYLIAVVSDNNIISLNNKLPWTLDPQWFRMHTLHGTVIMGRKTWANLFYEVSLKNRLNIILTRGPCPVATGSAVIWKNSLKDAIEYAYEHTTRVYIIGGSELFLEAFAYTLQGIILTRVHVTIDGPKRRELTLPDYKKLVYRSKEQREHLSCGLTTYHFELYIF
tara:strand:- start:1591 stop:2088 length:498 start_codon:yes stop_codon:yes gene_type:complete